MIYADNAATTRISNSVLEKMLPFFTEQYGNASSLHSLGKAAKHAINLARDQIARAIGAKGDEISFGPSGSEINSFIFNSIAAKYADESIHMVTSAIEHPSVMDTCRALEARGVQVTYLPVDIKGAVKAGDVSAAIRPNTKFVSIMYANNEIGTIQPIGEIGLLLKNKGIPFHTDAVQAVGHIPIKVKTLNVDCLTASAHKFHGAKGTGILYKRSGLELPPHGAGNPDTHNIRPGTPNVAGMVAAGHALGESMADMPEMATRLHAISDATVRGVQARIPSARVNGDMGNRLPGIVNLAFDGVLGESLMHLLDLKGICVSTGSACTAGGDNASHVLLALGQSEKQAKSAIRISYGRHNTMEEAEAVVSAICASYAKIMGSR